MNTFWGEGKHITTILNIFPIHLNTYLLVWSQMIIRITGPVYFFIEVGQCLDEAVLHFTLPPIINTISSVSLKSGSNPRFPPGLLSNKNPKSVTEASHWVKINVSITFKHSCMSRRAVAQDQAQDVFFVGAFVAIGIYHSKRYKRLCTNNLERSSYHIKVDTSTGTF